MAIEENEQFTVKDLIELLSSLEEDREVLMEVNKGELFCMIDTSPKKKRRRGRPRKIISFEDLVRQRRQNYEKFYGATAFKYRNRKWTKDEDELIMQYPESDDLALSEEMQRSVAAIQTRRWRLRKEEHLEINKPNNRAKKGKED